MSCFGWVPAFFPLALLSGLSRYFGSNSPNNLKARIWTIPLASTLSHRALSPTFGSRALVSLSRPLEVQLISNSRDLNPSFFLSSQGINPEKTLCRNQALVGSRLSCRRQPPAAFQVPESRELMSPKTEAPPHSGPDSRDRNLEPRDQRSNESRSLGSKTGPAFYNSILLHPKY